MPVLSCIEVDLTGGLLPLARISEVNFDTENGTGLFSFNFDYRVVSQVPAYDSVNGRGAFDETEVRVRYRNENDTEEMCTEYAELAMRLMKSGGFIIQGIPSIAEQRVFVTAKVAEFEKVAHRGNGAIQEKPKKIVQPDEIFEDEDKNWDLYGITATENVEATERRGKMRALQKKCRFASVEIPTEVLAAIVLFEQNLDLQLPLQV